MSGFPGPEYHATGDRLPNQTLCSTREYSPASYPIRTGASASTSFEAIAKRAQASGYRRASTVSSASSSTLMAQPSTDSTAFPPSTQLPTEKGQTFTHQKPTETGTPSHVRPKAGWLGSANVGTSRTPVNLQSQLENQSFKPSTPTTEPRALPTSRHPPNHLAYASLGSEQQASASKTVSSTTHDAQRAQGALAIDSGKIQDDEKLAVGMQGLGVKSLLPHQIRDCSQPQAVGAAQATSELWSFKKRILASKGIEAELLKPKSPSSDYLLIASRPSTVLDLAETLDKRPKLLVLDLNQTLLVRKHSTSKASKNATPRPYLSAFWEYICGYDELQPGVFQRRFSVMVWSSAEETNVRAMCDSMRLFTDAGNQEPLLVDIWDRSSLDLTPEQMRAKFTTTKDLNEIWRLLRWTPPTSAANTSSSVSSKRDIKEKALRWSQLDTILIDDTPSKAALQPYNHLPISSMVQPSKMNGLSAVSSSPYMQANGAGSGQSEYKPDTCLVQIVAILEKLRYQSNVSNAIMLGQAKGLNEGEDGDEWAKAGFEVLKEKGIKVTRDFDGTWAQRVVKPALQGQ